MITPELMRITVGQRAERGCEAAIVRSNTPVVVLVTAVVVLLAACAANPPNLGSRNARDIISSDEIVVHSFVTAYDAVRTLRPWWLGRLSGTMGPAVYRDDDQLSGGFLALLSVLIETVGELRFYETYDAVAKWGEAVARRSGVIQIVSRN